MIPARQLETAADFLRCAAHVLNIEFYDTKYENKAAELNCRIWGMQPLDTADLKALSVELNLAIRPVLEARAKSLKEKADRLLAELNG